MRITSYSCPTCNHHTSRKANLRDHCKRKHKLDPFPVSSNSKKGFMTESDKKLDAALHRVRAALHESFMSKELKMGSKLGDNVSNLGIEPAIKKVLDDHVLLSKKEVEGISGHFCEKCMTFDFSYIKRIGFESIQERKHICMNSALDKASCIKDKSIKDELIVDIELKAIDHLCGLVISLFGPALRLVATRFPFAVTAFPIGFGKYAPVIQTHSIERVGYDWLERSIRQGECTLSQLDLYQLIYNTRCTFLIVRIETGYGSGTYHLQVKPINSGQLKPQIPLTSTPTAGN